MITQQDIGKLFFGRRAPGLLAMGMYVQRDHRRHRRARAQAAAGRREPPGASARGMKDVVWPSLVLFIFVIGGL